uniref:Homeobox KN domain-containing protein n=1 Tax=Acrobeloides nanus TaxID=290746 RepID=A0A914DCT5_9BILA
MVATFITTNPPEISPKTQSTNPRKLGREDNFESEAKKSKLIENVHENENMEVDEEINRRVKKISITPSETDDDEAMLVAAEILEAAKLKTSSTLSSTSTNGTPNSNGTSNRLDKPILESQKRQFLEWMRENGNNLYPSRQDKEMLAVHLKASYIQVTRLLANHRRRQLKYKRLKGSTDSSPQENKENSLNLEEPTEEMQIPQSPSNLSIHSNSSIYQTPMNSRKRSHLPSTDIEAERERKIDETIMDIWNKVTSGKNEENTSKNPSEANSKELSKCVIGDAQVTHNDNLCHLPEVCEF